jgi:Superinfection immunity protein
MEEQMNALAQNPLFWGALIAGLLVLYVLPSVIGAIRKVEGLGWLIVINLIPTGIGWLAAMVMAFALPRREPVTYQRPYYHPQAPGQRW